MIGQVCRPIRFLHLQLNQLAAMQSFVSMLQATLEAYVCSSFIAEILYSTDQSSAIAAIVYKLVVVSCSCFNQNLTVAVMPFSPVVVNSSYGLF